MDRLLGGAIGLKNADGSRTLHVIVYSSGLDEASYESIYNSIQLPRGWQNTQPTGAAHHETGHAFVDHYLKTKTCNGSAQNPCTESLVEHWGVDEGISSILGQSVGGANIGPAPANSVSAIMEDHCSIHEYPKGATDCAHDIGRLVVQAFDELKALKGDGYARSVYLDAAVALRSPWTTYFSARELHIEVGQQLIARENVHIGEPPGAVLTGNDFRIADLLRLLELLGIRQRDDTERPHYAPH